MTAPPVGRTQSVALVGLEGHLVDIEVLAVANVPAFVLVGLPDAALGESRDRIRAAFASSGFAWPNKRVTVNLSPASLPKSGSGFDLGMAVAVLAACGVIDPARIENVVHLGELGLDGRTRPVRGILPAVLAAVRAGVDRVVVPAANLSEARLVRGARVLGVASLEELAWRLGAAIPPPEALQEGDEDEFKDQAPAEVSVPDLQDVVGQDEARLALEIAAAGGHHLLMTGPPGAGKTMLASRLPGILPALDEEQAVEVTAVHSVAGTLRPGDGLIRRPPYENPHHTATPAAIVGGGSGIPRPGAVSRAHHGVLFLDEAPEFSARVLQTLRQPLERGEVVIHRAAGSATYPARFHLVMAANPCPCGMSEGSGKRCSCTSLAKRRYFGRLSGPLLDRLDMVVRVGAVKAVPQGAKAQGESSAAVATRVARARAAQRERLRGGPWSMNSQVPGAWLRAQVGANSRILRQLNQAMERGLLSLRGVDRVLRLAWTVADLAGHSTPTDDDADLAMALRGQGAL